MINTNLNLKDEHEITYINKPFLLKPVGKDYIWGGDRLKTEFGKHMDMKYVAESWECSTHFEGTSYAGDLLLSDVLKKHPEYLGTHPKSGHMLPIMIKFIDAKESLSIQVHPDDEYAFEYENGQLGKTEMWYILDATKDARIIYGLNHDIDRNVFRKAVEKGTIEKYLQSVPVKKNDVFFIPSGMIHAIGAGCLIAEIQENSNLTYRLYDYDRVDRYGKRRELHLDKALDVVTLKRASKLRQPIRVLKYKKGCAMEFLCRCKYFEVSRMIINTETTRNLVRFQSDSTSFRVLVCIDGCGSIRYTDRKGEVGMDIFKGDTVFVPAYSIELKLHGKMQMLDVRC